MTASLVHVQNYMNMNIVKLSVSLARQAFYQQYISKLCEMIHGVIFAIDPYFVIESFIVVYTYIIYITITFL